MNQSLDFNNPPPVLYGAVAEIRETIKQLKGVTYAVRQRIAAIQADRNLSEEKRDRDIAEQRAAVLGWYDERFRSSVTQVAAAVAAVEAAVERKANPDPFEAPAVDLSRATAGESALAALSRATLAASGRAAEQVAAQRAESMLAEAIAGDPVQGPAKLRRELADADDHVLERAFDRVAPRRVSAPGARELLERTQAEIRDARLDEPLRELVGQTSELNGMTELLVGLRVDLDRGDFLATGKSAVLTALETVYPGIAE